MGTALGPLHLLTLGEALADDGIDCALGQAGGDALARTEPLAIVDQAAGVAGDIASELMCGAFELGVVARFVRNCTVSAISYGAYLSTRF